MSRVILLGPPGAGKGTHAKRLAEALEVGTIATGDLFRDHLARETELGVRARSFMNSGALVPDDVTIAMVMDWVQSPNRWGGFVLDGFPRSLGQAQALDQALEDNGGLTAAVHIDVPTDELIGRLSGRLTCRACQAPYHAVHSPPDVDGRCNLCSGNLYQREDDTAEAVGNRLAVYSSHTAPLIAHYRLMGSLVEINGSGTIEQVWRRIESAIARPVAGRQ